MTLTFIKTYLIGFIIIHLISILLFIIQKSFNIHVNTSIEAFDYMAFLNIFLNNIFCFPKLYSNWLWYIIFRNILSTFCILFGALCQKKYFQSYIGQKLSKKEVYLFAIQGQIIFISGMIIIIYYRILAQYYVNIYEPSITALKRFFAIHLMYAPIEILAAFTTIYYLFYIPDKLLFRKYKRYGEVTTDFALKLANKSINSFFGVLKYVIVLIIIAAYLETQVIASKGIILKQTPMVWNMTQSIFYYSQAIHCSYIYKPAAKKERWIYLNLRRKKADHMKKCINGIDECKEKLRGYLANNQLDYEKLNSIAKTILSRPDFFPIFNEIAKDVIDYSKRNNIMISSEDISKLEKELIKFNKYSVALEKDPKYLKYKTSVVTDEIKTVVIDRGTNFSLMKCFIQ